MKESHKTILGIALYAGIIAYGAYREYRRIQDYRKNHPVRFFFKRLLGIKI